MIILGLRNTVQSPNPFTSKKIRPDEEILESERLKHATIFYQDYGPLTFSVPLSKIFLLGFSILLLAVCNILFQLTVLVSIQYYNTILERNGQGDYREISPKYRFGFIPTRRVSRWDKFNSHRLKPWFSFKFKFKNVHFLHNDLSLSVCCHFVDRYGALSPICLLESQIFFSFLGDHSGLSRYKVFCL